MTDRQVLYEPWGATLAAIGLYAALTVVGGVTGMNVGGPVGTLGWVVAAFFGACVLLAVVTIFRRNCLILNRPGFTIASAGQRIGYRWAQVRGFYSFERSVLGFRRSAVGIEFVGDAGVFDTPGVRWAERLTTLPGSSTRAVKGRTGALPSTYGQRPDELVNLLERWRRANSERD